MTGAERTSGARRRAAIPALVLVAGAVLTGCGSSTDELGGRSFTSTEVRGHELEADTAVALAFEDGRISASAGCNTLTGEATWDAGTLEVVEPMASTMMGCEDPLSEQDSWLTAYLTSSPALALEGDTLTLGDEATGITLTEER